MATELAEGVDAGAVRVVDLPQGRRLVVRATRPDDGAALEALYEGLDEESRYRRFFAMYHPPHSFFERLLSTEARGGGSLVACTFTDTSTSEEVVGEASYEPLANGDGEFAITVARRWRGWLGPYLLDALFDVAAARGVLNLEAFVLSNNSPMLAMVRSRGYVVIPDEDFTTLHVSLATGAGGPRWPALRSGARLLIEGRGSHSVVSAAATAAGLEVVQCAGPVSRGRRCPLLGGKVCPLAEGADAIALVDPDGQAEWQLVREGHERLPHHPPVFVALHGEQRPLLPNETALPGGGEELDELLRGVRQAEQP